MSKREWTDKRLITKHLTFIYQSQQNWKRLYIQIFKYCCELVLKHRSVDFTGRKL